MAVDGGRKGVDVTGVHSGWPVFENLLSTARLVHQQPTNSYAHIQKSALTCSNIEDAQDSQRLLRLLLLSQ